MKNDLEYYLDFIVPEHEMQTIRTRCKCVDAMQVTKNKRIRKTLKKICKF